MLSAQEMAALKSMDKELVEVLRERVRRKLSGLKVGDNGLGKLRIMIIDGSMLYPIPVIYAHPLLQI